MRNKVEVLIMHNGKLGVCLPTEERGWYTFPGGGSDEGETFAEAGARECLEEVGIQVINLVHLECDQAFQTEGAGKNSNSCFRFFKADYHRQDLSLLDQEGDAREIEWLELDEALSRFGEEGFDAARRVAIENLAILLN